VTDATATALETAAAGTPWWAAPLIAAARSLECGMLTLHFASGAQLRVAAPRPGPAADMRIHRARAVWRILLEGDIGLGESYRDGDWDSGDVAALIELAARNRDAAARVADARGPWRLWHRLSHLAHANTRTGSRRNIQAHYDLGNDFYALWLDETLTYSAARFDRPGLSLAEAQHEKYRRLITDLDLAPGQSVLEIGCGWGGFAEAAARHGAHVTGLTLSPAQLAYAQARIEAASLAPNADLRLEDYRDVQGTFDRIVSIEMFEAVGEENWPQYFAAVRDRLKAGGRAIVQTITIAEDRFAHYRRSTDFIQKHIFPGGLLPSEPAFAEASKQAGLRLERTDRFRAGYAATLAHWAQAFRARGRELEVLGFDARFRRLWEFYLGYCEGGFRAGTLDVQQFHLSRP